MNHTRAAFHTAAAATRLDLDTLHHTIQELGMNEQQGLYVVALASIPATLHPDHELLAAWLDAQAEAAIDKADL